MNLHETKTIYEVLRELRYQRFDIEYRIATIEAAMKTLTDTEYTVEYANKIIKAAVEEASLTYEEACRIAGVSDRLPGANNA